MENNYTIEEQTIIDQANANGTYLKAPNGEETNLSPEQWVQVRTSAFKEWFGIGKIIRMLHRKSSIRMGNLW
jgi:hypothetical protein